MSQIKMPVPGGQPAEYAVNNSEEQVMVRKYRSTLVIVGLGIILFAVWTAVRTVGDLILKKPLILEFMNEALAGQPDIPDETLVYWVFCAVTVIYLVTSVFIRVFVGRAAIAEGRGRRAAGRLFLILTVILIANGIFSVVNDVITLAARNENANRIQDVSAVSIFIESTSLVMLADMLVSSLKLRRMRRR